MAEVWEVPGALDGERLDRALALLTGLSRREVNHLVDGTKVRAPVASMPDVERLSVGRASRSRSTVPSAQLRRPRPSGMPAWP